MITFSVLISVGKTAGIPPSWEASYFLFENLNKLSGKLLKLWDFKLVPPPPYLVQILLKWEFYVISTLLNNTRCACSLVLYGLENENQYLHHFHSLLL